MRDLHNNLKSKLIAAPDTRTATFNSTHLDLQGFDSAELIAMFGDYANTLGASPEVSWDVIIQHSDTTTSGDFAAVTDANDVLVAANGNVAAPDSSGVIATLDNDGDADKLLRIGYRGSKRYVRLRFVANNSPGATDIAAVGILGHPHIAPAVDVAAEINL